MSCTQTHLKWLRGTTLLALLAALPSASHAGMSFADDFNHNDVSDWQVGNANHHTIAADNGTLHLPVGSGTDSVTRFCEINPVVTGNRRVFSRGDDTLIVAGADIKGHDNTSTHSGGEMGIAILFITDDGTRNRYDFRLHSGNDENIQIRKRQGGKTQTIASVMQAQANHPDQEVNSRFCRYELRVRIGENSNKVEALIDGEVVARATDDSPLKERSISLMLFSGNNNDLLFDNVTMTTNP